jgi:hypothetical protein
MPKNLNDFRAGVICKVQPCGREIAAGLPHFLWETQRSKRRRKDPQAPKLKRQRYTKEMKQLILQTLDTSGTTLTDVANQFKIPQARFTLNWSSRIKVLMSYNVKLRADLAEHHLEASN